MNCAGHTNTDRGTLTHRHTDRYQKKYEYSTYRFISGYPWTLLIWFIRCWAYCLVLVVWMCALLRGWPKVYPVNTFVWTMHYLDVSSCGTQAFQLSDSSQKRFVLRQTYGEFAIGAIYCKKKTQIRKTDFTNDKYHSGVPWWFQLLLNI